MNTNNTEAQFIVSLGTDRKTGLPLTINELPVAWAVSPEDFMARLISEGKQQVEIISSSELDARNAAEYSKIYSTNILKQISADEFLEQLDMLPPVNWDRGYSSESFMCMSPITDNLYSHYYRIGRGDDAEYFEVVGSHKLTQSDMYRFYKEQIQQQAA